MPRLRKQQVDERFEVELGQTLVQVVTLDNGTTYSHRCPIESFKQIAHAIEESGVEGTTIERIIESEDLPSSQVAVARAFLLERSVIESAPRRRFRAASKAMVEDALTEFHALA